MSRVTQKGQVTIPIEIRELLDIKRGDRLVFEVKGDEVILRKKMPSKDAFRRFVGMLEHLRGKDADEIVDDLRGQTSDFGR